MQVTVLAENTTKHPALAAEHGLSLYVETAGHRILFDMGQSDLFCQNARRLGIDLSAVDLAILSHGHYDHGGGLATFLEINDRAPILLREDAFLPHYNAVGKYIGLDASLKKHPRLRFVGDEYRIDDALTLLSCNQNTRPYAVPFSGLTEETATGRAPDRFFHEQYLCIRENGKAVVLSGCSHKGIRNVVSWLSPDVLIGGFHTSKLPLDQHLLSEAEALAASPTTYYTCHCTGTEAFAHMKNVMPRLFYLSTGESIKIEE